MKKKNLAFRHRGGIREEFTDRICLRLTNRARCAGASMNIILCSSLALTDNGIFNEPRPKTHIPIHRPPEVYLRRRRDYCRKKNRRNR